MVASQGIAQFCVWLIILMRSFHMPFALCYVETLAAVNRDSRADDPWIVLSKYTAAINAFFHVLLSNLESCIRSLSLGVHLN